MRKYISIFVSIFILSGVFHAHILFAGREDDANKFYLDAYNLYKLGKMDESLEVLKKVTELNPDHAEAHFGMGSIYFRQNLFDDAVKEFTKVTRIKPEYVEAYQRLWLAYKKLGMNDKAEEELLKYKKLIEDRMQAMAGGASQVAKPVTPPPSPPKKEPAEVESKPEKPPVQPETRVAESRPSETEAKTEKPVVVKPTTPAPEESRPSVVEAPRSPIVQPPLQPVKPPVQPIRPAVEPPKTLEETKPKTDVDSEPSSPYIKVDRKNPAYHQLFKPFKKVRSALFQNPFKKFSDKWKGSYFGRIFQGIVYYIIGIQIWLCIVAALCIYFRKVKRE